MQAHGSSSTGFKRNTTLTAMDLPPSKIERKIYDEL